MKDEGDLVHAKRRDPARDPGVQLEITLPSKRPRSILVFPCNRRDTYAGLLRHAEADDSTRFIRPSWIQRSFVRTTPQPSCNPLLFTALVSVPSPFILVQ